MMNEYCSLPERLASWLKNQVLCVENLAVKNTVKNHKECEIN